MRSFGSPQSLQQWHWSRRGRESSLAGVLGQCRALAHLDLSDNQIKMTGQEGSQECWGSAHHWLTSISGPIKLAMPGQRGLQECWRSAERRLTSISATMSSTMPGRESCRIAGAMRSAGSPRSQK